MCNPVGLFLSVEKHASQMRLRRVDQILDLIQPPPCDEAHLVVAGPTHFVTRSGPCGDVDVDASDAVVLVNPPLGRRQAHWGKRTRRPAMTSVG